MLGSVCCYSFTKEIILILYVLFVNTNFLC